MQRIRSYVGDCVNQRLLAESPVRHVYWTPSISRKLARGGHAVAAPLGLDDFFVGTYNGLKGMKAVAQSLVAEIWASSEIHHIVENYHLQFLGIQQPIGSHTYANEEPCVLLSRKHHDTHVKAIIGTAARMVMEARPYNFLRAFQAACPGVSRMSRNEQGRRRTDWVREMEGRLPPPVTRHQIRSALVEIYRFAYQGPELKPLRLIATAVLRSMPL